MIVNVFRIEKSVRHGHETWSILRVVRFRFLGYCPLLICLLMFCVLARMYMTVLSFLARSLSDE